jgi:hypothetical protein
MLAVLACALLFRIVQVLSVAPPEFTDPPQLSAGEPLPPPPPNLSPRGPAMDAIVEGNLFESERGEGASSASGTGGVGGEPLPPPTNVVLNGIFVMEGRPMAIVSDSTAGNKQLTLRVGDNVGDYQVGDITERRVTLLGRGGQQFSLDLDIKKGPQGGAPVAAPARPTPPAAAGNRGQPPAGQTAAQRAAAARAAAANRTAQQQRARTAGARPDEGESADRPDPTQARLDALKRLREVTPQR